MAAEVRLEEPEGPAPPPPGADLPGAAWQEVARRSHVREVVSLARTCRGLSAWLRGNAPLWAALLERDYGAAASQQPQAAYLGWKKLYRELHGREAAVWAQARGEALQAPSAPSSLASGAQPPLLAVASNSRVVAAGRGDGYLKTFTRERRAGRPQVRGLPPPPRFPGPFPARPRGLTAGSGRTQWAPYEAMDSRAAHWPEMVLALAVTREHAVSCGRRSLSVHRLDDGLEVLRLATGAAGGGARTDSGRRHSIAHSHAAGRGGRPVNKVLAREDAGGAQLELLDAGEDGTCRLYDAARGGREVLGGEGLVGHVGAVYAAAWGPRPRTVLTGGFDGTVRLWDLRHGGEVAGPGADADRPGGGSWGPVFSLAARRGSPLLYSGHGDGAVRVWDVRAGAAGFPVPGPSRRRLTTRGVPCRCGGRARSAPSGATRGGWRRSRWGPRSWPAPAGTARCGCGT